MLAELYNFSHEDMFEVGALLLLNHSDRVDEGRGEDGRGGRRREGRSPRRDPSLVEEGSGCRWLHMVAELIELTPRELPGQIALILIMCWVSVLHEEILSSSL